MKRLVKIVSAQEKYDHIDLGRQFGCTWSATIFNDGREYVQSHHPYDDADYHWAFSKDGKNFIIYLHSPGQKVKTFTADEDQEYNDVVAELANLDRSIKNRMVHN